MQKKKIPMRTCVVTREKLPKGDLIRIVRTPEGEVVIDEKGKMNGRGAYLKKDLDTFKQAQQKKILDRHLDINVPDSIYDMLKSLVK